jgi:hypothetical protein
MGEFILDPFDLENTFFSVPTQFLTSLVLTQRAIHAPSALVDLLERVPNLEYLELAFCDDELELEETSVPLTLPNLNLKRLSLQGSAFYDNLVPALTSSTRLLTHLEIPYANLAKVHLASLSELTSLRTSYFSSPDCHPEALRNVFEASPRLKTFHLTEVGYPETDSATISNLEGFDIFSSLPPTVRFLSSGLRFTPRYLVHFVRNRSSELTLELELDLSCYRGKENREDLEKECEKNNCKVRWTGWERD